MCLRARCRMVFTSVRKDFVSAGFVAEDFFIAVSPWELPTRRHRVLVVSEAESMPTPVPRGWYRRQSLLPGNGGNTRHSYKSSGADLICVWHVACVLRNKVIASSFSYSSFQHEQTDWTRL